jgi:hypothetical protein
MSGATLLVELEEARIRLSLPGDDLRIQARRGVSITPYRELVTTNK